MHSTARAGHTSRCLSIRDDIIADISRVGKANGIEARSAQVQWALVQFLRMHREALPDEKVVRAEAADREGWQGDGVMPPIDYTPPAGSEVSK